MTGPVASSSQARYPVAQKERLLSADRGVSVSGRLLFGWVCVAILSVGKAATDDAIEGLVMARHADDQPLVTFEQFGGAPARVLAEHAPTRKVAVLELPAHWRWRPPPQREHTWELFVLEGELNWGDEPVRRYGHVHLPAAVAPPELMADAGARVLLFLDPPRDTDGAAVSHRPYDGRAWRPGVVAERDTGIRLPLEVLDLLWVESTGQRTWLLRAGPELVLPWERHETVEEGFILEGGYRLVECLPAGERADDYRPGGYFHRPPGVIHGGPGSGSDDTVVMLLRTPTALTVEFVQGCSPD